MIYEGRKRNTLSSKILAFSSTRVRTFEELVSTQSPDYFLPESLRRLAEGNEPKQVADRVLWEAIHAFREMMRNDGVAEYDARSEGMMLATEKVSDSLISSSGLPADYFRAGRAMLLCGIFFYVNGGLGVAKKALQLSVRGLTTGIERCKNPVSREIWIDLGWAYHWLGSALFHSGDTSRTYGSPTECFAGVSKLWSHSAAQFTPASPANDVMVITTGLRILECTPLERAISSKDQKTSIRFLDIVYTIEGSEESLSPNGRAAVDLFKANRLLTNRTAT